MIGKNELIKTDKEFNKIWKEKFSPICMKVANCKCCPVSKECDEITISHMNLSLYKRRII